MPRPLSIHLAQILTLGHFEYCSHGSRSYILHNLLYSTPAQVLHRSFHVSSALMCYYFLVNQLKRRCCCPSASVFSPLVKQASYFLCNVPFRSNVDSFNTVHRPSRTKVVPVSESISTSLVWVAPNGAAHCQSREGISLHETRTAYGATVEDQERAIIIFSQRTVRQLCMGKQHEAQKPCSRFPAVRSSKALRFGLHYIVLGRQTFCQRARVL